MASIAARMFCGMTVRVKTTVRVWILGLASVTLVVASCGCSVIGLKLGAMSDAYHEGPYRTVPGHPPTRIHEGASIEVVLEDGRLRGSFEGIERLSPGSYAEKYAIASAASADEILLPSLGETVSVSLDRGDGMVVAFDCEIESFDPGVMAVLTPHANTARDVDLYQLETITTPRGDAVTGEELRAADAGRRIPHRSALVVAMSEGEGGRVVVPVDEIVRVVVPKRHRGKVFGFLAGAAIDVAIVVAAMSTMTIPIQPTGGWGY
jgi:hypothetical protein